MRIKFSFKGSVRASFCVEALDPFHWTMWRTSGAKWTLTLDFHSIRHWWFPPGTNDENQINSKLSWQRSVSVHCKERYYMFWGGKYFKGAADIPNETRQQTVWTPLLIVQRRPLSVVRVKGLCAAGAELEVCSRVQAASEECLSPSARRESGCGAAGERS